MQNQQDTSIEQQNDQNMNIGKAAKYLGVSVDTLRRWEKKGRLTPDRSPGGHRYFKKENLENLFDKKYSRDTLPQVNIASVKPTFVTPSLQVETKTAPPQTEPFQPRPKFVVEEDIQPQSQPSTTSESIVPQPPQVNEPAIQNVMPPAKTLPKAILPNQTLTADQQEKLQVILADNPDKQSMTTFQKAAIIGLALFVIVDIVLVYLWYSSTRIISPIP